MKYINLTNNIVVIHTPCQDPGGLHHDTYCGCSNGEGNYFNILPSGKVAKIEVKETFIRYLFGTQCIRRNKFVTNLPETKELTVYIVSNEVIDFIPYDRIDVFAPDIGVTALKDKKDKIKAVTRLIMSS